MAIKVFKLVSLAWLTEDVRAPTAAPGECFPCAGGGGGPAVVLEEYTVVHDGLLVWWWTRRCSTTSFRRGGLQVDVVWLICARLDRPTWPMRCGGSPRPSTSFDGMDVLSTWCTASKVDCTELDYVVSLNDTVGLRSCSIAALRR